jgi:hypothetical protein
MEKRVMRMVRNKTKMEIIMKMLIIISQMIKIKVLEMTEMKVVNDKT